MSEFICRLGTPSGDIVTRVVEASGASDARFQLEREGFKVFAVSSSEVAFHRSIRLHPAENMAA
jgi:type IV pilus assembly protein PilC